MKKRNKYNYAFRLQCVEAVLNGNQAVNEVAAEKGLVRSNLQLWLSFYQHYGPSGLMSEGKQQFDSAFKLKVLEAIESDRLSLREACVIFNVRSDSAIISWRRAYESKGEAGLAAKPKGRPKQMKPPIKRKLKKSSKPLTREEELLLENEYLRAENELLKKLQALVQSSKKQKP